MVHDKLDSRLALDILLLLVGVQLENFDGLVVAVNLAVEAKLEAIAHDLNARAVRAVILVVEPDAALMVVFLF